MWLSTYLARGFRLLAHALAGAMIGQESKLTLRRVA
jgi:hypothetical protein